MDIIFHNPNTPAQTLALMLCAFAPEDYSYLRKREAWERKPEQPEQPDEIK